ncbi:MAG: transcription repressor NadR [Lachnospiraceae bacterium]
MAGEERRCEILKIIEEAAVPVSGTELARALQVSRQVIVQDIALLRAAQYDIRSTPKGYMMESPRKISRVITSIHEDHQIEEELNCIVDLGGTVEDVFVVHDIYGMLRAKLCISSRRDVRRFLEQIASGASQPLKNLTAGRHMHTILADSDKILDEIEEELVKLGFLCDVP